MEVFKTQQRRSRNALTFRAFLGLLLAALAVAFGFYRLQLIELGRVEIYDYYPNGGLQSGTSVLIKSGNFAFSELYFGKNEEKPDSYLYFVPLFDDDDNFIKILPVKDKTDYRDDEYLEDNERPLREFRGKLASNSDFYSQLVSALKDFDYTDAEARSLLPSVYSEPENIEPGPWIVAAIGAIIFFVNVFQMRKRTKIRDRMDAFGVTDSAIDAFDAEYNAYHRDYGKITFTEHYLFDRSATSTALLPLAEVRWIYGTVTQHRTNGIPTGKTYAISLYFSDKGVSTVTTRKNEMDDLVAELGVMCSNAAVGYSDERRDALKNAEVPLPVTWTGEWNAPVEPEHSAESDDSSGSDE